MPIIAEPGHSGWSGGRSYQLTLRRDAARADTIIEWYRAQGQAWIDEHTPDMVRRLRVADGLTVTVRPHDPRTPRTWATYRPGTHSIGVHWALFQCPRELVEYVLAHEIAHASVPRAGHGPEWENMLGRLVIDWRERKRKLADVGRGLWWGRVASVEPPQLAEGCASPWATV